MVGVVGRAHGIRGDAVVDVRTDEPERRFVPGAVLTSEDDERAFTVASARDHSGRLLVRFEEAPDRTAVEALRGVRLVAWVGADERPEAPEEFYDRQLVGLRVLDAASEEAGEITAVLHSPAQDVLEVRTPSGVRLVPFVAALVPEVDLAAGHVRLADLPGLLTEAE